MTGLNNGEADERDAYDDYAHYQPARSKKSGDPGMSRYEVARPSLKSLQSTRKAKFIQVYANGKNDPPVRVSFSRKRFPRMDKLLDEIYRLNKLDVRFLFKWPTGEEVYDVGEIEEEEDSNLYVCASSKANFNKRMCYGGLKFGGGEASGGNSAFLEKYSRNSYDSRRSDKPSPTLRSQGSHGALRGGQITITVISNTNKNSSQSLFIDPRSNQPFEEILKSIHGLVDMDYPPCKALYSVVKPYKKVESISTLKRVIPQYGDKFWACGREGDPYAKLDKLNKSPDESPTRNGRTKNGHKQNGHQPREERQMNGHSQPPDNQYEQYEDDDEEIEDYHQQSRNVSPPRNNNKRSVKQNEVKQSQNRQSRRYDEEQEQTSRDPPPTGRQDEEESPRRNDDRNNRQDDRRDDRRGDGRDDSEERNGKLTHRKDSSPPPTNRDDRRNDDDDDNRRNNDNRRNDEDNREVEYNEDDHPSEEEMKQRIDKMERLKSDLDEDIKY